MKRKQHNNNHGGMWKIAYADFMTAMMVLFFMLWIVNNVDEEKLAGLSDYFAPSIIKEKLQNQIASNDNLLKNNKRKKNISSVLAQKMQYKMKKISDNIKVTENQDEITITIFSTKKRQIFSDKSFQLSSEFNKEINMIAQEIKDTSFYINIIGYTAGEELDPNINYSNWELSADRASAIRNRLIKFGLDKQRISDIVGKADIKPMDNLSPDALQNKRVEIKLLKHNQEVGQNRKNTPGIFT